MKKKKRNPKEKWPPGIQVSENKKPGWRDPAQKKLAIQEERKVESNCGGGRTRKVTRERIKVGPDCASESATKKKKNITQKESSPLKAKKKLKGEIHGGGRM